MREPIVIVTASDEKYVRAMAAAIRSAIVSVPWGRKVQVYVLDGGISKQSQARLARSWRKWRVQAHWLRPNLDAIADMPVSHYVSRSTYLRIFTAELLPGKIEKAIYLDADTIVLRNLEHLWNTPLDNAYCAAVQEVFCPVLNPAEVFSHPLHCMTLPNMDPRPIPNYRELGLSGKAAYFNAGIMLVNVERWRKERVAGRGLEILRENLTHARFWDQYALNVLFSGQWKMLDPRWNQNSHVFQLPSWELSHHTEAELEQIRRDPWIVHFNYLPKPWDLKCEHPFRDLFFKHLDGTSWRGWRPQKPGQPSLADREVHDALTHLYLKYRRWRRNRVSPIARRWRQRLLKPFNRAA
jgi:lipopolysaccharide biosynthesis glycosyltransferase